MITYALECKFSIVMLLTKLLLILRMSRGVTGTSWSDLRNWAGFSSSKLYRAVTFSLDFELERVLGLILLEWRYENQRVLRSEPGHPESASSVLFVMLLELKIIFTL